MAQYEGELLVLLHQQETEEEPWQKCQGSTCQGLPQFFFPGLSGCYWTGKLQLVWVVIYLVCTWLNKVCSRKANQVVSWWTFLECLLCYYYIPPMSPLKKDACEKPMHIIILRNRLLLRLVRGDSSKLNPTGPHCSKQARESSIQRMGDRKGKRHYLKCSTRLVFDSDKPKTTNL